MDSKLCRNCFAALPEGPGNVLFRFPHKGAHKVACPPAQTFAIQFPRDMAGQRRLARARIARQHKSLPFGMVKPVRYQVFGLLLLGGKFKTHA